MSESWDQGMIFSSQELLFLMGAVNGKGLFGFPLEQLTRSTERDIRANLLHGAQSLEERALVVQRSNGPHINDSVATVAMLLFHPSLGIFTRLHLPQAGATRIVHYVAGELVAQLTVLENDNYRVSLLRDIQALEESLASFAPIDFGIRVMGEGRLTLQEFLRLKGLIEEGENSHPKKKLTEAGLDTVGAELLCECIENPVSDANIALVTFNKGVAEDGRNLSLLRGKRSAWSFVETTPGQGEVRLLPVVAQSLREIVSRFLWELGFMK